ncbi:hypothetical protein [Jiangella alba]|uniref:Uncharacterized protein n=1 Tax=Jiangella alba TaxID=561176 RepID=A0A1H5K695_9ACTN|nr:hypothetical protein [Jiangella alba]SEE60332.1 hypothetical protein SAMN04488561_1917 [Jiangella alba]
MAAPDYSDVVFSVHDTGDHIVRERPRGGAGAWTLLVLACLVLLATLPVALIVLFVLIAREHGFGYVALRAGPPAVVVLAAAIAVNALGERLTGRSSAGTRLMLGVGLLGFGATITAPLEEAWSDTGSNLPVLIAATIPGSVAVAGVILIGRAITLARGALRRQERMRQLRARGHRVDGVLESVRFLKTWAGSQPEFEVVAGYAGEHRVTARLLTEPERVPLPGARLWVHTDPAAPGDTDVLIELDPAAPVEFDPRGEDYRRPTGDSGGGGGG